MAKKQELQPSLKSQAVDKTSMEPAGLHVVDPAEHEDQESFGKEVEQVMGALLAAEADRAVLSITALRDALEFYQRGGAAGGGTRAAVRKADLTARLERIRFDAEQTRVGLWIDRLSIVCNWGALCGYMCIVLTFWFPNEAKFMRW